NRVPRSTVRLSRRNVFLRDGYRCMYCGATPRVSDLNLDHVVPRCRGGRSTWENLVTSCRECNLRKGRLSTEESGMHPIRHPTRPPPPPGRSRAARRAAAPRRFRGGAPFLPGEPVPAALREAGKARTPVVAAPSDPSATAQHPGRPRRILAVGGSKGGVGK